MISLVQKVVNADHILVMTQEGYVDIIHNLAPEIPKENVYFEPERRDNGPAIILGACIAEQHFPGAQVLTLWSDHYIQDSAQFAQTLETGFSCLSSFDASATILVGAKPTWADTQLGYIKLGQPTANSTIYNVAGFIEKPPAAQAEVFFRSWEYLWNVGYEFFTARAMLAQVRSLNPELAPIIQALETATTTEERNTLFTQLPKQAIEHLYTTRATPMYAIPADMGWSDIGSWTTLHTVLQDGTENGMVTRGPVYTANSSNSLVYAKDKPITVVGMQNAIVVDTGDSILIMQKHTPDAVLKNLVTTDIATNNPELT
jgi:mannose-1-phosphate guanylyltransferase